MAALPEQICRAGTQRESLDSKSGHLSTLSCVQQLLFMILKHEFGKEYIKIFKIIIIK